MYVVLTLIKIFHRQFPHILNG